MRVATDHRDAILQAAARLFARRPYHEVLMDDVAEQTGIAKGTIYRHFPNKDQLFAALSLRWMEMLGEELGRQADPSTEPLLRLERMLVRLIEQVREHQDFFQVFQRHEANLWRTRESEVLARRNTIRDHFVVCLADAREAGRLAIPFPDAVAADMLLGMLRNLLRFSKPDTAPAETARMILHVFFNGLKPRSSGGAQ